MTLLRFLFRFALVFLVFLMPFAGDWLRLVLMPSTGITWARVMARRAQCRFRVLFAGGVFIQARAA